LPRWHPGLPLNSCHLPVDGQVWRSAARRERLAGLRPGGVVPCRRGLGDPLSVAWRPTRRRLRTGRQPVDIRRARSHNYPPIESWNRLADSDRRLFDPVDCVLLSQRPPRRYSANSAGRYLDLLTDSYICVNSGLHMGCDEIFQAHCSGSSAAGAGVRGGPGQIPASERSASPTVK
jgi:hypothetical protein